MKKVWCGILLVFIVASLLCGVVSASDVDGKIEYYDTADLSIGSFVLPAKYDNHRFSGEVRDAKGTLIATVSNEEFIVSFAEDATNLRFKKEERWTVGTYRFLVSVERVDVSNFVKYEFPFEYTVAKPSVLFEQVPVGQRQYRLFLKDFLVADDAKIEASMLNENNEMVATTYLDFSSENLVGSMLTKTASAFEGYSHLEMITLFQTAAIPQGHYQLYFSIDEKLVSYPEDCSVEAVGSPIIYDISALTSDEFLYGENQLHPLIAGVSSFDVIVTGFQLNPKNLNANLYDEDGNRVAKSVSYQYHDTLLFGYGTVNGYQTESGIQAIVLHMETNESSLLVAAENYRISLSYSGDHAYGISEAYCSPETRFFVASAIPYDLSSLSLFFANVPENVSYDLYLTDNTYGEIPCGTIVIPEDGIVDIDVGVPLTDGQGMVLGSDGTFTQFTYKNDLLGLFIPQKVNVNPVVLHPTTSKFVAHFEMVNYSISENAKIDVELVKFAQQENGAYVVFEQPQRVAVSSGLQSITRALQNGYYDTHLLIEMKVNDALDENGLYSYLLTIDGHQIYLIDQGENYIVTVQNNSVYYAEMIDMTLLGGIPVAQEELHFACYGVVVADPKLLSFSLIDSAGETVAALADGSLTLLSMEAERQYCGKLDVLTEMLPGETYSLVVSYGDEILFVGEPLYGDDTADATIMLHDDFSAFVDATNVTVFTQLTNTPTNRISFSVTDLSEPYKDIKVKIIHSEYNFDTYYQYKHTLALSEPLREGVYKVALEIDGNAVSDAMISVTPKPTINSVETVFEGDSISGFLVCVDNAADGEAYGALLGRSFSFSDALTISDRTLENGALFLRKEELSSLSVGTYELFLTQNGVPLSGYQFYYSPFDLALEICDSNISGGELAEGEAAITLSFSQPLNINTVVNESFELRDPDGNLLSISVAISDDRRTVYVRPNVVLYPNTQYTLSVNSTVHSLNFGHLREDTVFSFTVYGSDLTKIDYFLSGTHGGSIRSDAGFSVSFLQDSFEEDVLLGVWSEDVLADLSGYRGLIQCSFVVEVTDYQGDKRFKRAGDLIFENCENYNDRTYVLLRYDPLSERYLHESTGTFYDNQVHTVIRGCGRYVLCLADELPFEDVVGTWTEEYVKSLWHNKVVSGYSEHVFLPDAPITRSEFVKMLVSTLGVPVGDEGYALTLFKDYDKIEKWSLPYWAVAYRLNVIKGTSSNTLSPNDAITRAEMITMIGRALSLGNTETTLLFTDSEQIPLWARGYFSSAVNAGIISGYADGSVRPEGYATRGETAKIMYALLNI